jgi:protein-S-isoprenylcysteine O-methyltransferase Ste14
MNPSLYIWIVRALWILLVIYLTISAIGVKHEPETHLGQSVGLTVAVAAAFILPHLRIFSFVNFAPVSAAPSIFGISLVILGDAVLISARQRLGRNWSQTVAAKEDHELVTSGPYAVVRHPMYSGGLVATIGSAITAGGAFVFLLIILGALFIWRTGAEDELMKQQFPEGFPEYKKRTKKLIPLIW